MLASILKSRSLLRPLTMRHFSSLIKTNNALATFDSSSDDDDEEAEYAKPGSILREVSAHGLEEALRSQLPSFQLVNDEDTKILLASYRFTDFKDAWSFITMLSMNEGSIDSKIMQWSNVYDQVEISIPFDRDENELNRHNTSVWLTAEKIEYVLQERFDGRYMLAGEEYGEGEEGDEDEEEGEEDEEVMEGEGKGEGEKEEDKGEEEEEEGRRK